MVVRSALRVLWELTSNLTVNNTGLDCYNYWLPICLFLVVNTKFTKVIALMSLITIIK